MRIIFDLDGTVIDSSHRYTANADGTLDLAAWIEKCTPELIAKDSLLPLARFMRQAYRNHTVIVCTARVFGDADYAFMIENDLPYHALLARPEGARLNDPDLKEIQLRLYAEKIGVSWVRFCETAIFIDDNARIIEHLESTGLKVFNATVLNALDRKTG
jgi:FMN phosphatase YigB (HAD superfamily)